MDKTLVFNLQKNDTCKYAHFKESVKIKVATTNINMITVSILT